MITIQKFDKKQLFKTAKQEEVNNFLFKSLQEYGDPKSDINDAMNYALGLENSPGGFVLVAFDENKVVGSVVVNRTGMKKYIPEIVCMNFSVRGNRFFVAHPQELFDRIVELSKQNKTIYSRKAAIKNGI